MRPNIFDISTKELTQDAFITWLLLWADSENAKYDSELNKCAVDFATDLIRKSLPDFNEKIKKVRADRQRENIDVWAEINDKYLIIIEDKTNTKEGWGQLESYINSADKWCNEHNYIPIYVYLKTGNESCENLNSVEKKGFKIYNRQDFILLLENYDATNNIYCDFKSRLVRIENQYKEWENKLIKDWVSDDWQGFFLYLDKQIELVNWGYVHGGYFWSAGLYWKTWEIYPVCLMIDEYKLRFKISTHPEDGVEMPENASRGEVRNKYSKFILDSAQEQGINSIVRPPRFGVGKHMTIALVDSKDWLGDMEEKIDKEKVVGRLLEYKKFIQNIEEKYKTSGGLI